MDLFSPCIQLVPNKRTPNIDLSLIIVPPPTSPFPQNIGFDLIPKPLQNLPYLILIKPTKCTPSIQLVYHFWNYIILQSLLPILSPLYFIHNYYMGRYFRKTENPISHTPCMPHCWYWNENPEEMHKVDRTEMFSWVTFSI